MAEQPLALPDNFSWHSIDLNDDQVLNDLYCLLRDHYVSDSSDNFRFHYSKDFLKWALQCPNYNSDWILAIRSNIGKKPIVAFISAIPVTVSVNNHKLNMAEINFLCVHHKLRNHRLAPVLIKEITRRGSLCGISQAVYTASATLPNPIGVCRYWHRSLNPKKLVDVGFSSAKKGVTVTQLIKLYKLPVGIRTPGLRPLLKNDCVATAALLNNHLAKFKLYMHFDRDAFEHWFCDKPGIVHCYVIENAAHEITDMVSFYIAPFTITNNDKYDVLHVAYMWYSVANTVPLSQLVNDMLIVALHQGIDVFNCLDIGDNGSFLKELKFEPGNGFLNYYLYNWPTDVMKADEIGLVMV